MPGAFRGSAALALQRRLVLKRLVGRPIHILVLPGPERPITIPGRPLWPARTILARLLALKPGQRSVARALNVYTVYGQRSDPLANVRALLPPGLTVVGFMGDPDDIDISLWRPFFARRVEHILLTDTAAQIRQRHIQYAVVGGGNLAVNGTTLAAWLPRVRAECVAAATATVTVTVGPQSWYLVRFPE